MCEECNDSEALIWVLRKLGNAYTKIGAWDDAIASLEKGVLLAESIDERLGCQLKAVVQNTMGNTYLEKFYTEESLVGIPERNDELIRKAFLCSEAAFKCYNSKGNSDCILFLDLAQEYYFLGKSGYAHAAIHSYLDGIV